MVTSQPKRRTVGLTRLIYHIAYEEVPNEVATEADRCRLALMGLTPAIRSKLMQDHASTIAKAKASNRPSSVWLLAGARASLYF